MGLAISETAIKITGTELGNHGLRSLRDSFHLKAHRGFSKSHASKSSRATAFVRWRETCFSYSLTETRTWAHQTKWTREMTRVWFRVGFLHTASTFPVGWQTSELREVKRGQLLHFSFALSRATLLTPKAINADLWWCSKTWLISFHPHQKPPFSDWTLRQLLDMLRSCVEYFPRTVTIWPLLFWSCQQLFS